MQKSVKPLRLLSFTVRAPLNADLWILTRGTEVYIRKVAPLGDPVEVTVRNYELSIRKADAEMIEIEAE